MKYTIVKHESLERIVARVNKLLEEGWELLGGVAMCSVVESVRTGSQTDPFPLSMSSPYEKVEQRHYAQAMIHREISSAAFAHG